MKKIFALSLLTVSLIAMAAKPFAIVFEPKESRPLNHQIHMGHMVLSPDKKELTLKGRATNNKWLGLQMPLSLKAEVGKKYRFSGEVKAQIEPLNGSSEISLRQNQAPGKSLAYEGTAVRRSQDWKPFEKVFTVKKGAVGTFDLYFVGYNLDDKSSVSIRNLQVKEL